MQDISESEVDNFFDNLVRNDEILYLTRKAKRGDIESQYKLAECYRWGRYVSQDHHEAIRWYKKSAEQGHERSIQILKRYYRKLLEKWKNNTHCNFMKGNLL